MRKQRVLPAVDEHCLSPESQVQVNHLQVFAEETLEENNQLREENARLKDEVAILKGEKKRPGFKPSRMNEDAGKLGDTARVDPDAPATKPKRAGSAKRSKTGQLRVEDLIVNPEEAIPDGSRFKGDHDFTVQDIVISTKNTRYRLARWQTPDGQYLTGKLPKELQGRHFGPGLIAHVLHQHHHCHVTQPLLHEQLRDLKEILRERFYTIFTQKTSYTSLNLLLSRLHKNKAELLLVLDRPEIPLHTNGSEGDIRGHVLKQKISGGTRSDLGRKCRDTFSSLKKTCRKLGISFWSCLIDRISCSDQIPALHHIIEQRIAAAA